jgi:hypothetical protein
MRRTPSFFFLLLLTLGSGLLVGCGGGSSSPAAPPAGTPAEIRVVHASPDAPRVDVYVEGLPGPVFTLSYQETSDYAPLPAGSYNFQIYGENADPLTTTPVFETGLVPLEAGQVVTAIAAGSLAAGPMDANAFRVIPLVEGFGSAGSDALARVVHAGPDAPAVAIDLGDDGTPDFSGLAPFTDTGAPGILLPAAQALQVGVLLDSTLDRVTAFTTPQLAAGSELFVIATGFLASKANAEDGFGLLVVAPTGTVGFLSQNPVVYGLHASPDTGNVDLALAGSMDLLADNLMFSDLTAPIQVPAGAAYSIDVRNQGGGTVFNFSTPVLDAGETYLAIVTGYSSGMRMPGLTAALFADTFAGMPAPGNALLAALHASPDAGTVDIGTVDMMGNLTALTGFDDLMFGDSSQPAAGTEVPTTPLLVGIAAANSTMPLVSFDVALSPEAQTWAIAVGTVDTGTNPGDEGIRLVAIDTSMRPWQALVLLPIP